MLLSLDATSQGLLSNLCIPSLILPLIFLPLLSHIDRNQALLCLGSAAGDVCHLYSNTIESPCFTTVKNASTYEVRRYGGEEMWTR